MSWAALSAIRILPWQADSFFFIPGCIIIYFIYLFLLPVASSFLNGAADCCLTKRKNAEANVHILPFFPTFFASETIYWIPQATICYSNYWCYIAFLFSAASWLCTRLLCALRWNLLHNDSQTPMHFECSLSGVLNPPPIPSPPPAAAATLWTVFSLPFNYKHGHGVFPHSANRTDQMRLCLQHLLFLQEILNSA